MNHMNSKTVIGLGMAAVVAIAVAAGISASRKPHSEATRSEPAPALPELAERPNEVKSLSLTGAGSKLIATLEKGDKGWSLKEKGGYPADAGKVREYLLKLSQARLVEQKTANEQRYADLGVNDVTAADAKGVLVALDGLGKPVQLIVGIMGPRGDATFVRRAGDKQSWLAKGSLVPDKTAANWLDKSVADIPATRVRELSLQNAGARPLRVFKAQESDTNYQVADLPKGRELSSEFAANTLGTTLAGLNFEDVFAAAGAAPPQDGKVHKAKFTTFDGLTVEVTSWKEGDKTRAQLQAGKDAALSEAAIAAAQAKAKSEWDAQQAAAAADSAAKTGDAAKAEAKPAATPPVAVSDPAKDKAERLAKLDAEVASLSQRFSGWTFELPAHKAASLDQTIDGLLKPLEEKKPAAKK
jgi:Domain of unknown function (DUF4340)